MASLLAAAAARRRRRASRAAQHRHRDGHRRRACRARACSSSPIRRPTRSPPDRDPAHAAIAVTAGALALLDREETQGVVAHEMAHIGNRDTLVMTMVSVLFGGVVMLADWARRSLYFARQRRGRAAHPARSSPADRCWCCSRPLLSRLLAMAVSRRREYQADATAVELTRNPEGLARALEKIARQPLAAARRDARHGAPVHRQPAAPTRRRARRSPGPACFAPIRRSRTASPCCAAWCDAGERGAVRCPAATARTAPSPCSEVTRPRPHRLPASCSTSAARCGGIWCDRWELYPLAAAEAARARPRRRRDACRPPTAAAPRPATARAARSPLRPFRDPALPADARIERCPVCDGMWLNRGELRAHQTPRASTRHPAQAEALAQRRPASTATEHEWARSTRPRRRDPPPTTKARLEPARLRPWVALATLWSISADAVASVLTALAAA